MWALIANLFSGGAFGAIAGLGGTAIQKYFEFKGKAQDNAHELQMKQLDIETMKAEAESRFQVEKLDAASREDVAKTEAFQASYLMDAQSYADKSHLTPTQNWLMVFLDFVRGMVRPGLTAYLAVFVSLVFWAALGIMKKEGMTVSPEEAYSLVLKVVDTVLNLFTGCTFWYFGQRMSEQRARK